MKQILSIITLIFVSGFITPAYAIVKTTVSPTPSVTTTAVASPSGIDQQINTLKEKIASQVAQMKLVEKRGILGVVSDSANNQITLTDIQGNIRFIDVDELTKFSSGTNKTFGLADITKGMTIGVMGNYNKESKRILARFITAQTPPTVLSGVIISVDTKNLQFHIATATTADTTIDIQPSSKMLLFTNNKGIQKVGFTKLKATTGTRAFVIGIPDKKTPTMIVASTFYALSDVPVNPKLQSLAPATAVTPTDAPSPTSKKTPK